MKPPAAKTPTTAADVCRPFELSKDAQSLLQPTLLPRPYLEMLIAHQLYQDAARLMAHAMPRRESIWWGSLCARHAYEAVPAPMPPTHLEALKLAEQWIVQPTDECRREAFKAAEAAQFNNPAGLLGMAIFFSSGSLGPPGVAEISAEPHLCQSAVGSAVIVAAVMNDSSKAAQRYPTFFGFGFDVANGKNRWKGG